MNLAFHRAIKLKIKRKLAFCILTTTVLFGGCVEPKDDSRCFQMRDGERIVTLEVHSNALVIYEQERGKDVVAPERIPGRLTSEGFRFPDGRVLLIEGKRLTWPEDSLLEGSVFDSCECPR